MTDESIIFLFEFLTTLWIFSVAACFGSFLNVVVYRLPLGLNLSHPPSRCPYCETQIHLKDNIPIFGWIKLKGRCRGCDTSISFRYPLIEAFTSILFIYILFTEVLSGGANLPIREPNKLIGVRWTLWQTQWDLVLLYCYHMFFLYVLLGSVLMEYDRQTIPLKRLVIPTLFLGILLPCFYPTLLPVSLGESISGFLPSWTYAITKDVSFSISPIFTSLTGCVTGAICGTLFLCSSRKFNSQSDSIDFPVLYMICGSFLGWQSVLSIALIHLAGEFFINVAGGYIIPVLRNFSRPFIFYFAVITHITYWKTLSSIEIWPSHDSTILVIISVAIIIFVTIIINDFLRRDNHSNVV